MNITVETVTPELASEWLALNTKNRSFKKAAVVRYAADMTGNRWRMVGDPIRFSDDGVLLDGQHRLAAVVLSSKPQQFVIIRGLPKIDNLLGVIDEGVTRLARDEMAIRGVANANGLTAGSRLLWMWRRGSTGGGTKVPNTLMVPFVLDNEVLLSRAFRSASRIHDAVAMGPTSAFTAAAAIALCVDETAWESFEDAIVVGAGLDADDPVLAARAWWLRRGPASNTGESQVRAYTIMRAFIARRQHKPMARLQVVEKPVLPDDFDWNMLKFSAETLPS